MAHAAAVCLPRRSGVLVHRPKALSRHRCVIGRYGDSDRADDAARTVRSSSRGRDRAKKRQKARAFAGLAVPACSLLDLSSRRPCSVRCRKISPEYGVPAVPTRSDSQAARKTAAHSGRRRLAGSDRGDASTAMISPHTSSRRCHRRSPKGESERRAAARRCQSPRQNFSPAGHLLTSGRPPEIFPCPLLPPCRASCANSLLSRHRTAADAGRLRERCTRFTRRKRVLYVRRLIAESCLGTNYVQQWTTNLTLYSFDEEKL